MLNISRWLILTILLLVGCTSIHSLTAVDGVTPAGVALVQPLPTPVKADAQPILNTVEVSNTRAADLLASATLTVTPVLTASETTPATHAPIQGEELGPDAVAQAIELYRKNYCGYCHTLTVADTHGIFGPNHDQAGALAATRIHEARYHGAATTASEYLFESLTDPEKFLVDEYQLTNHHMPAFTHLSHADLLLLVQLLLQQQ